MVNIAVVMNQIINVMSQVEHLTPVLTGMEKQLKAIEILKGMGVVDGFTIDEEDVKRLIDLVISVAKGVKAVDDVHHKSGILCNICRRHKQVHAAEKK